MKKYMTAFQMTQSMFCSLPFPCRAWDEKCRPYMMLFLPMVGLEIGILWGAADQLLRWISVPSPLYGVLMCAIPFLLTGFMHLDGFMDVTDAIGSWRDLEKRRAILKDSHVGSFAVVWSVFLILSGFAAFSSMPETTDGWVLLLVPMVSRCCSALAVIHLKPMQTSQYAHTTNYPRWHSAFLVLLIFGSVLAACVFWHRQGLALLAGIAAYGLALKKAYRLLEGMNGDISGFCICISELAAAAVLAFC